MIFAILIFLFFSSIYSFAPLIKERQWGELSITILIFVVASLYALQFQFDFFLLPNPGNLIAKLQPWAESLAKFTQLK